MRADEPPPFHAALFVTCELAAAAAAVRLAPRLVDAEAARGNAHKALAVLEVLLRKHLVHAHLHWEWLIDVVKFKLYSAFVQAVTVGA